MLTLGLTHFILNFIVNFILLCLVLFIKPIGLAFVPARIVIYWDWQSRYNGGMRNYIGWCLRCIITPIWLTIPMFAIDYAANAITGLALAPKLIIYAGLFLLAAAAMFVVLLIANWLDLVEDVDSDPFFPESPISALLKAAFTIVICNSIVWYFGASLSGVYLG